MTEAHIHKWAENEAGGMTAAAITTTTTAILPLFVVLPLLDFFFLYSKLSLSDANSKEREVLNRAGVGYLDSSHDHFMRISATLFLSFFLFLFLSLPLLIFTHVLIYAMIYIGSLSIFFSFSWFLFLLSLFPGFRLIHSLRSFRRLYRDFVFILYYC